MSDYDYTSTMQEVDAVGFDCVSAISLAIPDPDNYNDGIALFNGHIHTLFEFISVKITESVNGRFRCPYSSAPFLDTIQLNELDVMDKDDLRTLRDTFMDREGLRSKFQQNRNVSLYSRVKYSSESCT